jgi:mannose-6-phosphate isomerase
LKAGVDVEWFTAAIRAGSTLDVIARQPARAGDTWFIPAGTVHALGPGIFLYEVQQSSDITYRVYDWERPASAGRELHIEQAIASIRTSSPQRIGFPAAQPGRLETLIANPYFNLSRLYLPAGTSANLDTQGESFQALTAIVGGGVIVWETGRLALAEYATAIVPAGIGPFELLGNPGGTLMIASA